MGGINNSNNKDNRGSTRGNAPFVPPGNKAGGQGPMRGPGSKGGALPGAEGGAAQKGGGGGHGRGGPAGGNQGGAPRGGSRLDPSHQHEQMKKDRSGKHKPGK